MVVCAVKLCRNYTGKNIKPPEGISFHRFPTDDEQKKEWIRSIRREQHWTPGTHCRVCSVHFDNAAFKISETGRRILHKDAVPTKNLYQEERTDIQGVKKKIVKKNRSLKTSGQKLSPGEHLLACRSCLATDTKLFDLESAELEDIFEDVSSTLVSASDGLPHYVCSFCAKLLLKCSEFRTRCETVQDILEEAHTKDVEITTDFIKNIDRKVYKLTLPLSIKTQRIIDTTEIDIKQEHIELLLDDDTTIDLNHDDNEPIDDAYDIFDDNINDKETNSKVYDTEIKVEPLSDEIINENNENNSHTEVFTSDLDKSDIFVEVNTECVKEGSKKRKGDIKVKKKSKKFKKDVDKPKLVKQHSKEDIRNTKARKTEEDYEAFSKLNNVDIVFLSKEEQIAEVQARKESDNYKNSKYKCEECFKGFTREPAFTNHMAKHDPSIGVYRCEPCGFRFPKRYKMLHHLSHHKMNFVCRLCGLVSKLPSKAKEHFKWHNGVKYPCHFCDKTFIKRTSQFNHMRNRHGSACCDICQQIFSGERGLSAHMIKAHKHAVKSRCESCGVQFHTEDALNKHLDRLPDGICENTVKACQHCGDNFGSEEQLNEHCKENHWKEIKCEKCNANFENEKLYRMHSIIHKEHRIGRPRSELKWPPSPSASPTEGAGGEVSFAGAGLKGGKKVKKPVKLQKRMCEMCGLTWRSTAALKYHQRVHTGEKPHQCPACPKSFRIQDSLQIHMNTHTGARPFKCPHCPKAFKSRTQNHKHQLVHTKVRRYRCDLCDKTFQTSTCVKTHIKSVHMKIPAPPRRRSQPMNADMNVNVHMGHQYVDV